MQAQAINGITVINYGNVDGSRWLTTGCRDYDAYCALPQCVSFQGLAYGLTGWNSDQGVACYQTTAKMALDR